LADTTPFRTEQLRFESGERFVLTVDADETPVWWPNLYCQIGLRERAVGYSTMQAYMTAICVFHNVCARLGIDIDARIESLELFRTEELASLREELRKNLRNSEASGHGSAAKSKVVRNAHWKHRLAAVRDYIVWRANPVIDRMSLRDERLPEARQRLKELPGRLVGRIMVHRNTSKEGMDESTERAFLAAITPGHPTNPFNRRNQVRNQALWLLYYAGLRRSEAIVLACRNLHLNGDDPYVFVPRMQDDPEETRWKEPRTKTLAHPVSLSLATAKILHDYVTLERPTYPGAKKSKYLFLSQEGKASQVAQPLSIGSVVFMYEQLRKKVPGLPEDFTTHMARRTNKDRMGDAAEELGLSEELAQQVVNQQSGWTPSSRTSLIYQRRRLRRKASQLALNMQEKATGERKNG
jgi:integrase